MELARICIGDKVKINIRGRVFDAIVEGKRPGEIDFRPLSPGIGYRTATARQVEHRYPREK